MRALGMTAVMMMMALTTRGAFAAQVVAQADETGEAALEEEEEGVMTEDVGPTTQEPQASLLEAFFSDLNASNVQQKLEALYSPAATYDDPSGHYDSRDAMLDHLKGFLADMNTLAIEVREEFVSGDETVALWTATMTHKGLHSGEPIVVEGVTHAKVKDGKVVAQRDYYDMGGVVYENVPVIGMLVRWVKGKLK